LTDTLNWRVEVPMLNNYYMVMDILFVILGSSGMLGALLFVVMGGNNILDILEILVLSTGGLIVLSFILIGVVFLNKMGLIYRIDGDGVRCDLGEYTSNLNRLAWMMSSASKRVNPTGGALISNGRENTFVPWTDIEKAVFDGKKRIISVSSARRLLLRLYCTHENYEKVAEVVDEMLPDAELKLI